MVKFADFTEYTGIETPIDALGASDALRVTFEFVSVCIIPWGETLVSGLRFFGVRLTLSIATIVLLTGCCSTCPSISGRFSDSLLSTDIVNVESDARAASPVYLQGLLKTKMDERGRKSGCGEFFWAFCKGLGACFALLVPCRCC